MFPSQKPLYTRLQHLLNVHVQNQGKFHRAHTVSRLSPQTHAVDASHWNDLYD
jgi:hypothetical protein